MQGGGELPRVLVVGYRKFAQLMNTVVPEFRTRADLRIIEHIFDADGVIGDLVGRHRADVVVSAGANAAYLAATLDVPVISLRVSDVDMLEALTKASELSRRVTVATYGAEHAILPRLERLLGIGIDLRSYQTAHEAREKFLLARGDIDVVVGSSLVCELAEREGVPAILLYSRDSCRALLEEAVERAAAVAAERRQRAWREALLDDPVLPTVLIDAAGTLRSFNPAAARAFADGPDAAANVHRALQLLGSERSLFFNEQRWVVSRAPVRIETEVLGEALRFIPELPQPALRSRGIDPYARRLVYASREMAQLEELVSLYAAAPGTVLIQGESGTGKELVAHALHARSVYADGELVAVNCGAIPEELFESELFGYVEGAFTSSRRGGRRGLFEQAHRGVIFLDEIGEMPLSQQAKLLRVLEERRVRPLGTNREVNLDLKVVAATNCDLRERVHAGRFREDLFYRLNVFYLYLPPLRERPSDIPEIARYLLSEYAARYGQTLDEAAVWEMLAPHFSAYAWGGNVRELENFVERIVVSLARFDSIEALRGALPRVLPELFEPSRDRGGGGTLRERELDSIREALARFDQDKTRAAEYLGISQTTLWRRLKHMGGDAGN
jgi:propionate catabolism operon transcriptional regulator